MCLALLIDNRNIRKIYFWRGSKSIVPRRLSAEVPTVLWALHIS
jgi:hypothetical protein